MCWIQYGVALAGKRVSVKNGLALMRRRGTAREAIWMAQKSL
jgi:hypothetical protein